MHLVRTLRALTALLMAGSGFLTAPTDAAPAGPVGAHAYHRPQVGGCHQVRDLGAESDTRRPVRCGARHDLLTVAAPVLPGDPDLSDQPTVLRLAETYCRPALVDYLGPERRLDVSAYTYVFFVPTATERARGAQWLRCDLRLTRGRASVSLPRRVAPLGRVPLPDRFARCLVGAGQYRTTCARAHDHRAVGTVAHRGGRYPADRGWSALADRRCPALVGGHTFGYSYPSRDAWRYAQQRLLVCYSTTHH